MRVVLPAVFRAIETIAEQQITSELPAGVTFPDDKLDALILAARAVLNDDDPMDMTLPDPNH